MKKRTAGKKETAPAAKPAKKAKKNLREFTLVLSEEDGAIADAAAERLSVPVDEFMANVVHSCFQSMAENMKPETKPAAAKPRKAGKKRKNA